MRHILADLTQPTVHPVLAIRSAIDVGAVARGVLDVPEPAHGVAARVGRRHARADELFHSELNMEAELVIDVASDPHGFKGSRFQGVRVVDPKFTGSRLS
jgi:hypothetical protein